MLASGALPRERRFLSGMLETEIPGGNGGTWQVVREQRDAGSNTSQTSISREEPQKLEKRRSQKRPLFFAPAISLPTLCDAAAGVAGAARRGGLAR